MTADTLIHCYGELLNVSPVPRPPPQPLCEKAAEWSLGMRPLSNVVTAHVRLQYWKVMDVAPV